MERLLKILAPVISWGELYLDPALQGPRRIRALTANCLVLAGVPAILLVAAIDFSLGLYSSLICELTLLLVLYVSLRLNKIGKSEISAPLATFGGIIIAFTAAQFMGKVSGFHFLFLSFLGMPILIFEPQQLKLKVGSIALSLAAFFYILYAPESGYYRPIEVRYQLLKEIAYISVALFIILSLFLYWSLVHTNASKKIMEQQVILTESNHLSSLGIMAAGIAHEINNPLMIIKGVSEILVSNPKGFEIYNNRVRNLIDSQSQSVEQIRNIVDGLRTLSRDGRLDNFEVKELAPIVLQSIFLCRENAKNRGVKLMFELNTAALVSCREVQLGQIILNLVGNAFDAVEDTESPWVKVNITTAKSRDLDGMSVNRAFVTITDSGNGIKESLRSIIMTPFFTTKPAGKGTGLGLSISASIMEAHRGSLTLDHLCDNTSFVLEMPIAEISSDEGAKPEKNPPAKSA